MKQTRKDFLNSLNYCKKNKTKIADKIMADKFKSKDSKDFWKEIKKRRPNDKLRVDVIDGYKEKDIVNLHV